MIEYCCKNKSPHYLINYNLVFLNRFDEKRLNITVHDCVDRIAYHIDYQKEIGDIINPLCVLIPEFLVYIKKEDSRKYLFISHEEEKNNDVLKDCDKIFHEIFGSICDMDNYDDQPGNYCLRSLDEFKINSIRNDEQFDKLLIDTLLKVSCAIISNRLVIKRDSKSMFESYLEECFYETV